MKYSLLVLLTIGMVYGCAQKMSTSKIAKDATVSQSFFYALPRNTLNFEVKIKKTHYKRAANPAWFGCNVNELAELYDIDVNLLRILTGNPEHTEYSIAKDSISMDIGAKPDTSKIFGLNVNPKFFTDNVVGLTFTQDYLLSEATISQENRSLEMAITGASTLIGLASTFTKGASDTSNHAIASPCNPRFAELDKRLSDYSSYIVSSISPYSTDAYQNGRKHHLKLVQKEFEKLFYKTTETVYSVRFTVDVPNNWPTGRIPLFSLNQNNGQILLNQALTTIDTLQTPDRIRTRSVATSNDWYHLQISRSTKDVNAHINQFDQRQNGLTGLVYNVPASATITLWGPGNSSTVFTQTRSIAQFGKTASINPKFTKASVTLDPITGALLKASGESKSVAASNITSAGEAIGKSKELFTKPTELEELEKKAKILELKAKIKELENNQ